MNELESMKKKKFIKLVASSPKNKSSYNLKSQYYDIDQGLIPASVMSFVEIAVEQCLRRYNS